MYVEEEYKPDIKLRNTAVVELSKDVWVVLYPTLACGRWFRRSRPESVT